MLVSGDVAHIRRRPPPPPPPSSQSPPLSAARLRLKICIARPPPLRCLLGGHGDGGARRWATMEMEVRRPPTGPRQ
ncbi:hypothetical protein ABZP36_022322 [Zizania latifolia]